jgi:hypothetical protein
MMMAGVAKKIRNQTVVAVSFTPFLETKPFIFFNPVLGGQTIAIFSYDAIPLSQKRHQSHL